MILKSQSLRNPAGEPIHFDLRYEEGTLDAAVVIILHGFKGFKDWGFFPDLGRGLTQSGYVTLTMNFSRNGIGIDAQQFTELDKFAENTYSHELEDVRVLLEAVKSQQIGKRIIDPGRIGIMGHSRGGPVALLSALENENDISAVVTWASVGNLFRYSDEQIEQWQQKGYIEIKNSRTGQIMRMNKSFWDDLSDNRDRFDLESQIEDLETPALFIHGSEDSSVPADESRTLHEKCGSLLKRLEIIEGADHTFGIKHPMESRTGEYGTAYDLTEHWFDSHLNL